MKSNRSRAAWIQGTLSAAAIIGVVAALVVQAHRPYDRQTLSLDVEDLHSQAAETEQLLRNDAARHLAPVFTRTHAEQLAGKVRDVLATLRDTDAPQDLDAAKAAAIVVASELERTLSAAAAGDLADTPADAVHALALRGDALAGSLGANR